LTVVSVLAVDIEADEQAPELNKLAQLLTKHEAGSILVAGPVGETAMRRVADLALLHHCGLLAVMPTETLTGHSPVIVWSGDSPLVQMARIPRRRWEAAAKRCVDVLVAALGLIVAAPILALLAVLIRLDSPGSPVFRHERVGRRGRRFRCLKLRTMRIDAEDQLRRDPLMYDEYRRNHFKIPEDRDPRTTGIGRLLRRTSLDELPQLWNVLIGEMSIVGPRPVVADELEIYGESADLLLSVRPGITGAWAVGGRHAVGYPHRCQMELSYVRQWTLATDLLVLIRTVRAVAR